MPLGVVSDDDFTTEVTKATPIISIGQVIEQAKKGRVEGTLEVPDSLRKVIGETGAIDGRQEALALGKMFGISSSAASAYANGANSTKTYDTPNPGIKSVINRRKERISKKASHVLNSALGVLTEDGKLDDVKPVELASIAKSMSSIIKEMEPEVTKVNPNGEGGPTFVLFAPTFIKEDSFDVININE